MSHPTDVAIIGGGIIGLATAYELSRQGVRATVLEGQTAGAGQSSRNWGFVRQQGRSPQELPMMCAANRRWRQLEDEIGERFQWVQGGNLALSGPGSSGHYRAWAELGRSHGLDTRLVSADEVRELVPGLSFPHQAAMYTSTDGHVDPMAATTAIGRAAERGGATIRSGHRVLGIERHGDRVTGVRTEHGVVSADTVVCAAGATSRWLLRSAGIRLPQDLVRGTVALTESVAPVTTTSVWAPGLAFRQRPDGRFVVTTGGGGDVDLTLDTLLQAPMFLGAFRHNYRKMRLRLDSGAILRDLRRRFTGVDQPHEPRPTRLLANRSILRFRQAMPALAALRLERAWAGLIDGTPDGLPVLDRPTDGLVLATGFSGHGFGLGPTAGEVAAALVTGKTTEFDLRPFRFSRFAERDYAAPTAIL